ncbi:MAG: hypothetical protein U0165_11810 [Polyangiaceae bacterium]
MAKLVAAMMAKNPEHRPSDGFDVLERLSEVEPVNENARARDIDSRLIAMLSTPISLSKKTT